MSTECTSVRMMASLNVNRTSLSNENKQKSRRRNNDGVTRLPFNHRLVEPPNNAGFCGYHCDLRQKRVFVARLQPNGNRIVSCVSLGVLACAICLSYDSRLIEYATTGQVKPRFVEQNCFAT
jgi:hypothetical protein